MTIDELIEYVLRTPFNTNPNVLRSMLVQFTEECKPKSNFLLADDKFLYVKNNDDYEIFTVTES